MIHSVRRHIRAGRRRFLPLAGLLCLLLAQGAGLAHSHDGGLKPQFDCEICLKTGPADDAAAAVGGEVRPRAVGRPPAPVPFRFLPVDVSAAGPRGPPVA